MYAHVKNGAGTQKRIYILIMIEFAAVFFRPPMLPSSEMRLLLLNAVLVRRAAFGRLGHVAERGSRFESLNRWRERMRMLLRYLAYIAREWQEIRAVLRRPARYYTIRK